MLPRNVCKRLPVTQCQFPGTSSGMVSTLWVTPACVTALHNFAEHTFLQRIAPDVGTVLRYWRRTCFTAVTLVCASVNFTCRNKPIVCYCTLQ